MGFTTLGTSAREESFCVSNGSTGKSYLSLMTLKQWDGLRPMTSDSRRDKDRKESLERLQNQYEQAKVNGDTALMKKIKAVIDRVKK